MRRHFQRSKNERPAARWELQTLNKRPSLACSSCHLFKLSSKIPRHSWFILLIGGLEPPQTTRQRTSKYPVLTLKILLDIGGTARYTQSSFTVSQAANATMSFTFFGTSVGIYGAKRGNHGPYQVQVDNQQYPVGNGVSTPDGFNQTLFSTNLQKGLHTVTLTNTANTYLDVDYVCLPLAHHCCGE